MSEHLNPVAANAKALTPATAQKPKRRSSFSFRFATMADIPEIVTLAEMAHRESRFHTIRFSPNSSGASAQRSPEGGYARRRGRRGTDPIQSSRVLCGYA